MFTYVDILLKNTYDIRKAEDGLISPKQVRMAAVRALVDTGTGTLVIPESIGEQLGLKVKRRDHATLAGGGTIPCKVTEPVTICWEDRDAECKALILPGEEQVLLGVVPLEVMDLTVNPNRQCVEGAHGAQWVFIVK